MSEWLECSECSGKARFPDDFCVYVRGEVPSPFEDLEQLDAYVEVPTWRVWCKTCVAPSYAERVPSARELIAASTVIRNPDNQPYIEDELAHRRLEDIQLLFEGLKNRATAGKCLTCGGLDWLRIDIGPRGTLSPDLRHDECGGPLGFRMYVGSFNGGPLPDVRVFAFDGRLIAHKKGG